MVAHMIHLVPVSNKWIGFLYTLLAERDPKTFISHKSMPTYDEHTAFVKSQPYTAWYVIVLDDEDEAPIGSIYLSKRDEIGIFLQKQHQGSGLGMAAMELLMAKHYRARYLANISPSNDASIGFFTRCGFRLIQHTFEKTT
jgi:RimJ/RimL family protein N-acetyltransferase